MRGRRPNRALEGTLGVGLAVPARTSSCEMEQRAATARVGFGGDGSLWQASVSSTFHFALMRAADHEPRGLHGYPVPAMLPGPIVGCQDASLETNRGRRVDHTRSRRAPPMAATPQLVAAGWPGSPWSPPACGRFSAWKLPPSGLIRIEYMDSASRSENCNWSWLAVLVGSIPTTSA